jgi:hypothetical protein
LQHILTVTITDIVILLIIEDKDFLKERSQLNNP